MLRDHASAVPAIARSGRGCVVADNANVNNNASQNRPAISEQ